MGFKAALPENLVKTARQLDRLLVPSFRHADEGKGKSDIAVVQVEKWLPLLS